MTASGANLTFLSLFFIFGQTFVVTASGANMNFDSLRFVSERSDASETLLSVVMPEKPGGFRELMTCFEKRNVTEFAYRYGDTQASWPTRTTKNSAGRTSHPCFSLSLSLSCFGHASRLLPPSCF